MSNVYTFNRKKDSRVIYWQCKGKRTLQCKVRLYTLEKTSVIRATEHSYPSSATHIETLMTLPKIKNDSSMKDKLSLVRDVLIGFIYKYFRLRTKTQYICNRIPCRHSVRIPCIHYPFTNRIVVIPHASKQNHHRVISTSLVLFDSPSGYSECVRFGD